jgi:cyclophilin family peptidyl-prolyl cis-trans isomerase
VHTVFGQIINPDQMKVVNAIRQGDRIQKARVVEV